MKRTETSRFWGVALALALIGCVDEIEVAQFAVAVARDSAAPEREACRERDPLRRAYFGDLHVHTGLSSDASMYDVKLMPDDAYRYAFGEPVRLPPLDENGRGTREVRIDRPLDFAAVTDHAEFLGEGEICTDPADPGYASEFCVDLRAAKVPADLGTYIMNPWSRRDRGTCGDDLARCDAASSRVWQHIVDAAERWNDTGSACERTAFVAYEWSSFRLGSNFHRNVIFRNATVPRRPVSSMDVKRAWELWEVLRETCLESGSGCDVLAIPHNSNISNGRLFALDYPGADGEDEQRARARLRVAMEPIVEVMQHKGDSECAARAPGVLGEDDPFCAFEEFAMFGGRFSVDDSCYTGPLADWQPHLGPSCFSPLSYARYALTAGLAEEARIGVNPYKFGLMASTDTHNALAGGVEERSWPGHLGIADDTVADRVNLDPRGYGGANNGPGGLVGVWAEENSRDSIFDAMERREVFGTSGPRIRPRFFGGWGLPDDLCEAADPVGVAYAKGVPMGADLPTRPPNAGAPMFVFSAERDAGTAEAPGGLLQRIQVVKGWVGAGGELHQQVIDVAGGETGAGVDPERCAPSGEGHAALCSVWRDPDFDPERRAVYYARVLENPSCRYSAWQCVGLEGDERPADCDDPALPRVIQERAWTSPIWYTPAGAAGH